MARIPIVKALYDECTASPEGIKVRLLVSHPITHVTPEDERGVLYLATEIPGFAPSEVCLPVYTRHQDGPLTVEFRRAEARGEHQEE